MDNVDFGFTDNENTWLPRKRKQRRDNTVLVTIILVEVVVLITLFHFFVLPSLIPNIK